MQRDQSRKWFERAQTVIAGGVNSPARSFQAVGGNPPVVMQHAEGAYLVDVDGNRYVDYLAAFGPLVLGHNPPRVTAAIRDALNHAPLWGTPAPAEIELAEELTRALDIDQIRLTVTGTEAVMSVIRLARAYTGRSVIVKFEGTYHGHSDAVLVRAGSGAATSAVDDSAGVPPGVTRDVISVPYNDVEALREVLAARGAEVALVLTEPIVGNMGIVAPQPGYLEQVVALSHRVGALVAFDEVITAFRFHYGSAAQWLGVHPDLLVLGKVIGGGLPQGAYGGRREIMQCVTPAGAVFQAGTLAGNPLSCAAGLATLATLRENPPYARMEALATQLETGLLDASRAAGVTLSVNRVGSALTAFFGMERVVNYVEARRSDADQFARFHRLMLDQGIYLAPSRFEAWFVSAAHGVAEIERTVDAIGRALSGLSHL